MTSKADLRPWNHVRCPECNGANLTRTKASETEVVFECSDCGIVFF
jgi:predicted RNA-binding Zn-ribbon protein involved in translation (DUF1610 family)